MTRPFVNGTRWWPLLAGVVGIFLLFDRAALWLGSDRGQAGLIVGTLVVAATLLVDRLLLGEPLSRSLRMFGWPTARGVGAALSVSVALALVIPAYALIADRSVTMHPGWAGLVPGLFTQAGVAEETLFRGYLFGHLRRGRTFWHAAALAAGPFVLVHLILFTRLAWPVALASVVLAAIATAPLAYAWELGGRTIWAPAILHTAIQGIVKVIIVDGSPTTFALVWIAASAAVPYLVFAVGRLPARSDPTHEGPP